MGTEVLRPQDCLIERIGVAPAVFHRRKSCYGYGNNAKANNKFRKTPDQKKRFNHPPEPTISKRSSSAEDLRPTMLATKSHHNYYNHNQHMMGQVTILRRGESLDSKIKSDSLPLKKNGDGLIVCGTGRLGPDPEMVPKQIRISPLAAAGGGPDMYAGSAFSLSPSPRALPLPSFFSKKQGSKSVDDSATRDLRRLLRLD